MGWKKYNKKMKSLRRKHIICNCLKCGDGMQYKASLCPNCLTEEFKKMDHGDSSGYLYAAEQYHLKKQSENKKKD